MLLGDEAWKARLALLAGLAGLMYMLDLWPWSVGFTSGLLPVSGWSA